MAAIKCVNAPISDLTVLDFASADSAALGTAGSTGLAWLSLPTTQPNPTGLASATVAALAPQMALASTPVT
jgi:hypothetical protein